MGARKHGSTEAWEHGSMGARKHGSMEAWKEARKKRVGGWQWSDCGVDVSEGWVLLGVLNREEVLVWVGCIGKRG